MSAPDTGYHAPIDIDAPVSLAAHRARRARKQSPYPTCVELKDLQGFEGVGQHESAQRDVRALFGAMAAVVVFLLVLVVLHLLRGTP